MVRMYLRTHLGQFLTFKLIPTSGLVKYSSSKSCLELPQFQIQPKIGSKATMVVSLYAFPSFNKLSIPFHNVLLRIQQVSVYDFKNVGALRTEC